MLGFWEMGWGAGRGETTSCLCNTFALGAGEIFKHLPLSDMALKATVLCTRLLQCRRTGAPLAPKAVVVG